MEEMIMACPACEAENEPLDSLGTLIWYKCRACGMMYHDDAMTNDEEDDDDA
jgi:rubredoxin